MNLKLNTGIIPFIIATIFLFSCAREKKDKVKKVDNIETKKQQNVVKMHPIIFGGNRYVVMADLGLNEKVPLMVHGNASMYLMLTHEVAEKLNSGKPVKKVRDYGYSKKGMGFINVDTLKIESNIFLDIKCPIFDWPKEVGKSAQGMLGRGFLIKEKVKIDFSNEEIELGTQLSDKTNKELLSQGYEATNFMIDNGEVYTHIYFDALKRKIPITVSTVSTGLSLHYNLFKGKIKMKNITSGTNSSGYDSPSHTTVDDFVADSVKFELNNIPMVNKAELNDFAKYNDVEESELTTYGILGRDWMKDHDAIIDYANQILYFKPNTKANKK